MKTNLIFKALFLLIVSINTIPNFIFSVEATHDECSMEILRQFFPEKYVRASLNKFDVPKDKQQALIDALHQRESEIVSKIEANAEKISPGLLKDPEQRKAVVKLTKEIITEIATGPFNDAGIRDPQQIRAILDNIQSQKIKEFQDCIRKRRLPLLHEKDRENSK